MKDVRGSDRSVTEVLDALRRIVRVLRATARKAERDLGISGAQLFVLQQLAEAPARSVNALAERTHTHQSSVSAVVRRLAERGLVTRRRSQVDSRQVELSLTAAGQAMIGRNVLPAQTRLIAALRRLAHADCRRLAGLLGQVVKEMGLAGSPAPLMFEEAPPVPSRRGAPSTRQTPVPRQSKGVRARARRGSARQSTHRSPRT